METEEDYAESARKENQILNKLKSHKNFVKPYAFYETKSAAYIVMERL